MFVKYKQKCYSIKLQKKNASKQDLSLQDVNFVKKTTSFDSCL